MTQARRLIGATTHPEDARFFAADLRAALVDVVAEVEELRAASAAREHAAFVWGAKEMREAAAKVCDALGGPVDQDVDSSQHAWAIGASRACRDAIRAIDPLTIPGAKP